MGPRVALCGALLACACQHDSNAVFDDSKLPSNQPAGSAGNPGSAGSSQGGSSAATGESGRAGQATGGAGPGAGASAGGAASAGAAGRGTGGKGGGAAGKGGAETGGAAGQAAGGGKGGSAGSVATGGGGKGGKGGAGGSGGNPSQPEPMTVETTNIDDTDVQSCMPNANFGSLESFNVDGDTFCVVQTLINAPLDGVPDGALVSDASLTLTCTNVGEAIAVSYVDGKWDELEVRWNDRPQAGTLLGHITCDQLGEIKIDLTQAVKAWLAGEHENFGIYLRTDNTDGSDFDSSEAATEATRPRLSVTYTLPVK
jgi:hypothetical protein